MRLSCWRGRCVWRAIERSRSTKPIYLELEPNGAADSYTAHISATDPPAPTANGVAKTRIRFPDIVGGVSGRALPSRLTFESVSNGVAPPATAVDLLDERIGFDPRGGAFWPDASDTGVGFVIVRHQVSEEVRAVTVTRRGEVRVWRLIRGGWQ